MVSWLKGVGLLTLCSDRVECLWEEPLPIEVKALPDDLAALDRGKLGRPNEFGYVVQLA